MKIMVSNRRRNVSSSVNSASASSSSSAASSAVVVILLLSSLLSLAISQITTIPTTNAFIPNSLLSQQHHRNTRLFAQKEISDNETFPLLSKIKTSSSDESKKLSLSSQTVIIGDGVETNNSKENNTLRTSRRSALLSTAKLASAALFTLSISNPSFASANAADVDNAIARSGDADSTTNTTPITTTTPISASWKAVDGLNTSSQDNGNGNNNNKKNMISFESSAYKAMINDESRTPLFYKTIEERISQMDKDSESRSNKVVIDLGTGPYAIFAIKAAECGANKVYAIEADAKAAQMARETIIEQGYDDIITVIEGYSTDIELPNNDKADLIIAEIIGSIVSEEGCVPTILDASKRFAKNPTSSQTWIPQRVQTIGCPASYTLHNLFQPPSFDWSKLNGEPVRFNCRDEGLQLLCTAPQIIEDIEFAKIETTYASNMKNKQQQFVFHVDETLIETNKSKLLIELQNNKLRENEALKIATQTSTSFSGIALWPRLILNGNDDKDNGNDDTTDKSYSTINSRSYPNGDHQKSHWQTVLPIMNDIPIVVNGSTKITMNFNIDLGDLNNSNKSSSLSSPSYKIDGNVITTSTSAATAMPVPE